MMSLPKLILFDLDDTLIHFKDYWKPSLIETFRTHKSSKELDPDQLFEILWKHNGRYEVMYHNKDITLQQFRNYRFIDTLADVGRSIDETTAEGFNSLHKTISKSFMKSDQILIDLLAELQSSFSLGIVTNGTSSWQHDKIEAMGIRSFFTPESIIISEEIGFEKPAPEIYHKALSVFHIPAEETLFIGDSWLNDVEGPGNVGIGSIWFNKKKEEVRKHPRLKGVITKIEDLKHFL
jgi:HAD superfamily hydrolase (TIGR01549 family)